MEYIWQVFARLRHLASYTPMTSSPLLPRVVSIGQEILVTRSNLEDKNTLMIELKNKVDELALHNEYQLRLKDMNYSEKIKVRFLHTRTISARTSHFFTQMQ